MFGLLNHARLISLVTSKRLSTVVSKAIASIDLIELGPERQP